MRASLAVALALLLRCAALAGPNPVQVETQTEVRDPFVVRVTGHDADFHLGHSRHWKDVPCAITSASPGRDGWAPASAASSSP